MGTYETELLYEMRLTALELRIIRVDIIGAFKTFNGIEDYSENYLKLHNYRGHNMKIKKQQWILNFRKFQSHSYINVQTVNHFKQQL